MPSERARRQIDRLLDEAEAAAAQGDWATVRARADAVLAYEPDNEDARVHIEAAERRLGGEVGGPPPSAQARTGAPKAGAKPSASGPAGPPVSFASGRYAVKEFLGEGGKKKVYLAHDTTLDRDVAFALINTNALDDTSRQRVTREAQAMGRLGDHPNIVPIFDLGQEKDPATGASQPFLVLPLMTGGDVEGLVENAPDHRIPLERVLQIAKDTCEGLMFAHSKGIVHRDLKPGNVWLSGDGRARIGDFGLAVATDRSRLTREGMMVGTVSYMPPEQAMGGEITPRADLYSLGAMLYEMVTGRPPFLGDDDIAVIGQHINTPPVAPTWHNPQCPRTLDTLIMRLLAKDPAERPESAADVLAALKAIDLAVTAPSEEPREASLDSMAGGTFVGRQREMDQLKAALEGVLSGKGRMVTLVGEPGIGKTRTAQELATYASMRGAAVLWGRSYESGGAPPYWPWVQAIRSFVTSTEPDALKRHMGSTASVIAEIVPDVKERLPGTPAPPPVDDPESARFRLFDAVATFLKTASNTRPIVLMLEDLHWADRPSLLLLEFVARELSNSRVLVVGNYRDVELNRRHPLSMTLGDLTRERLFDRVVLRGLQRQDVERFIEIAAGITPPAGLVDAVYSHTEGNPLFVTETVRLLIQEGDLGARADEKQKGTSSWEIRIPEGVREVIGRRLDRLSERCNDVLTTAAVIGRQFRLPVLVKLVEGATENTLLDVMDEAIAGRIVEEVPSELGLFQFTHAQMQETLLTELSHNRAVRMHARIAEALEELYGDVADAHAAELVEHFAEAQTVLGTERFVRYSRAAGEQALAGHAYESAQGHFRTALDAVTVEPAEVVAALHFGLGRALLATAQRTDMQAVVDELEAAFDGFLGAGDKDSALQVAQLVLPNAQGSTGKVELLERALELAGPDRSITTRLNVALARWYALESYDFEKAAQAAAVAESSARDLGDEELEFRALTEAYMLATHSGTSRADDAVGKRLEALVSKVDAPVAESTYEGARAYRLLAAGRIDDAFPFLDRQVRAAERSHSRWELATSYANRVWPHVYRGEWKKALAEIDAGRPFAPNEPRLLSARIQCLVETGELANADQHRRELESNPGYGTGPAGILGYIWASIVMQTDLVTDSWHEKAVARTSDDRRWGTTTFGRIAWLNLALLAAVRGDSKRAAEAREQLGPPGAIPSDMKVSDIRAPMLTASIFSIVHAAIGMGDLALQNAEEAAREAIALNHLPKQAWTKYWLSDLLSRRGDVGDAERASALSEESMELARKLSMKPLLERLLARRKILKA